MAESLTSKLLRWKFAFFPCYRGTGARVRYVAEDFREVRIEIPHSWRTWNYVGSIFGGSMFAATDPIYMIMLIRILGEGYTVWDKAASIRFLKPGRTKLSARFVVDVETTDEIIAQLSSRRSIDRVFHVELEDEEGMICAEVERTIYIRNDSWKGERKEKG